MFIIIFFLISILVIYLIRLNSTIKPIDYLEEYSSHYMSSIEYPTIKRESKLELYFKEVENYHALSDAKEKELANDIQNGDQTSLEILVKSHLRTVIQIAKEISPHLHPELIYEGNLGLIEAGREYDGKSIFRKFAKPYVIKNIQKELSEYPDNYKDPYEEPSKTRVRVCGTCLVNRKHQRT